ncbi:hypothetical protein [Deinococcus radiodurans]|nr:hypothetical protein [Deinococcus radiodurans]UID71308.1 hypothetical protein DRO_2320 [Deinococcus radiodurans R1 = ATCC 13939 = DSM 20539]
MTATTPPHKLPVRMLGDLVSARSLEKVLQDAALARGVTVEQLWPSALADVLKHDVYRRLLLGVSPMLAKKRILDVLNELDKLPSESLPPAGLSPVSELEDASRRFTLYFDWPETQRLRGVLGTARTESEAGRNVSALVQEGQTLIGQMERRLQEGLVQQEQELAELRDVFGRVQPLGGKDVRRLESLIGQLEEAQKQGTLLPAELERARNLSFKLRRSLESSVMQSAGEAPAVDAQARVQALEQEEVTRKLIALQRDYAPLLRARPELERQQDEYRVRQSTGRLSETAVDAWRETLEAARQQTLQAQREELAELAEQLGQQVDGQALNDARVALDVARMTLQGGGLATEELRELRAVAQALTHSPELAERILEGQRELAELERSARDVPGAAAALAVALTGARQAIERGEAYDLAPLWATLERQMSQAAAQRQDFDARADFVIAEYDEVRGLAGETIQRLGRLADALRAQRRLGPMSADARERYAQTLDGAEALLGEARAEYEAAQKVTATFGEDALDNLLDVFDFGGESLDDAPGGSGLFGGALAPTSSVDEPLAPTSSVDEPLAPAKPAEPASSDPFAALLGLSTGASASAAQPASVPDAASSLSLPAGARADIWQVRGSAVVAGPEDGAAQGVAALLAQADALGLYRLDMGDDAHVWSARAAGEGEWRLARAADWDSLDDDAGPWLDTGEL